MKRELISIIVPVYNVEKYLDRCVESIISQTYPFLEIILVDDGSTDRSGELCDIWSTKDDRIIVIHKKNGGLSDARNVGMKLAKGQYIGFVDSDDYISTEMFGKLKQALIKDGSDIAACSVEMVWEDDLKRKPYTGIINDVLDCEEAQLQLVKEEKLKQPVWNRLYKSELVKELLFPVGKYHEDVFWSYQVIGKAKKVSIIGHVGYYYMQRDESIMGEQYSLKRLDALEALDLRQKYLERSFPCLSSLGKRGIWFSCLFHGQHALKELSMEDLGKAEQYIDRILQNNPLYIKDIRKMKRTHQIWLLGSKFSFWHICRIRNRFEIGL